MREIDVFSKVVGAMGAFGECVACGAKNLALGAPVLDPAERDEHYAFALEICSRKGIHCAKDDDALLTDLFPVSMNKDRHNIVFYKDEKHYRNYEELKTRKRALIAAGKYTGEMRKQIAYEFGKILSYSDADIQRMIDENEEKEVFDFDRITISGQISFLYFDDLPKAYRFFEDTLGLELICNQGDDYCHIYRTAPSSYIGCVDRKRGSVKATTRDGVLTSLVVNDMDNVYKKLCKLELEGLTSELKISERLNIKSVTFMGPEGYKFEVEEFLDPEVRKKVYAL